MQCRICLDEDGTRELISPCECKGTMKYVHRTCLNKWRINSPNSSSLYSCDQCKFEYILTDTRKEWKIWKNIEQFNFQLANRDKLLLGLNIYFYMVLVFSICIYKEVESINDFLRRDDIFYTTSWVYNLLFYMVIGFSILSQQYLRFYTNFHLSIGVKDKIYNLLVGSIMFFINPLMGLVLTSRFIKQFMVEHYYIKEVLDRIYVREVITF